MCESGVLLWVPLHVDKILKTQTSCIYHVWSPLRLLVFLYICHDLFNFYLIGLHILSTYTGLDFKHSPSLCFYKCFIYLFFHLHVIFSVRTASSVWKLRFWAFVDLSVMNSCKILNFYFVVQLANGYPLPALKNMDLKNTQLQVLKVRHHFTFLLNCRIFEQAASVTWPGFITRVKHLQKSQWKTNCCCSVFLLQDYMLIGTDVQFTGWMVRLETPTIP